MTDRAFDLVVFGATGYVGELTAEHLARAAPSGVRIALAGRDEVKLHRLRDRLPTAAHDWPLIVADVSRPESLQRLAEQTKVVITTVGPYVTYGKPLVAACAAAGTHYADLTGEVLFIRDVIDAYNETAKRTGARIVNACGFDSIPSDLGVLELHLAAGKAGAGELTDTSHVVTELRGGLSGGTFATMKTQVAEMRSSRSSRQVINDPYALSPDRETELDRVNADWSGEADPMSVARDKPSGRWVGPFMMSSFNSRIVRRSNALLNHEYGKRFRYVERLGLGEGLTGLGIAVGATAGTAALAGGLLLSPTRAVLDRLLPSPGEGPTADQRAKGRFRCEFNSMTTTGAQMKGIVAAAGDPGYAATAVMFGETGLALALDDLPAAAGVLTPATGLGTVLSDRLRRQGFTIDTQMFA